jgi:hypothetical protein
VAIYLGRGMGVQIGVHNIAPCFVGKGGTSHDDFLEGAIMAMVWIQLARFQCAWGKEGGGGSGRLEQKVGRWPSREHVMRIQMIREAWRIYSWGSRVDEEAGGKAGKLEWGHRWVCGGQQMCQGQEREG